MSAKLARMDVSVRRGTGTQRGPEHGERGGRTPPLDPAGGGVGRGTRTTTCSGRDQLGRCDTRHQNEGTSDDPAEVICREQTSWIGGGIFPIEYTDAPGEIPILVSRRRSSGVGVRPWQCSLTERRSDGSDSRRETESASHANDNRPLRSRPDQSRTDRAVPRGTPSESRRCSCVSEALANNPEGTLR